MIADIRDRRPAVIEEHTELRNLSDALRRVAAGTPDTQRDALYLESLLKGWHDREGVWTNLRNIEHWLERSRR